LPRDEPLYEKKAAAKYQERINLTPNNEEVYRVFEIPTKNLGVTKRKIRVC